MYILVRVTDNVIVGCANNPVNVQEASKQGRRVYEIDDAGTTNVRASGTVDLTARIGEET